MRPCGINPTIIYRPYSFMAKISAVERGHFLTVIPHFAWRLVNPATLKYFDAPHRPMYMQEYLYSIRNHRYTATMLQHIAEDRGEYVRQAHFPDSDADNPDTWDVHNDQWWCG